VPKFGDITNVWSTIREINVSDIRESAEQQIQIAIIGAPQLREAVTRTLYVGPSRYPSAQRAALHEYDVPLPRDRQSEVGRAELGVLVVDVRGPVSADVVNTADKLAMVAIPTIVLLIGTEQVPETADGGMWYLSGVTPVFAPDTQPDTLAKRLVPVVVDKLPEDLRIAAARRLPGLRDAVGRWLIGDVSFSNATYALTSGLPEMIPVLNLPLNAADMLVLTKNQALLVYKLALAFGAPPDFQAQMREVLPVIGGGFLWRQVARQLVGLIPGFGILPKVAVSYAGTYATGQAAAVWYRSGEVLSQDALRGLYKQAMQIGRARARELMERRKKELPPPATGETKRIADRPRWWRRFWPFRRRNR
jgi:uncharacterized protein (DUF697 family)